MIPEAIPFWMRQRQVKAEPAGEFAVKLTAPNLPSHEIAVESAAPGWKARLYRLPVEGQKVLVAEREFDASGPEAAWMNAYELYRQQVII